MKYTVRLTALSIALLVGGMTMSASANGRGPDFDTLDANGDGQLTQAELSAHGEARFAAADGNGDGALSLEELQAMRMKGAEKRAARMMKHLDANEDGQLTQDEMKSGRRGGDRAARMFQHADADGDGAISKEEFDTAKMKRGKRQKKD